MCKHRGGFPEGQSPIVLDTLRRFTKRLPGFHDMEYSAKLDKLNSQSLEYRRLVADLILTYKIIFGLTDIDLNVYFRLKGHENARIRGNPYKIVVNQCRLNVRKNFLVSVLLSLGIIYSLPPSVVSFTSLRTFRRNIFNVCVNFFLLSCIIVCYFYSCIWHDSGIAPCLLFKINKYCLKH